MRKRFKLDVECGDANYVKPGEYFATLSEDGRKIISLQMRNDDLTMSTIAATPVPTEEKSQEQSIAALEAGDELVITPSSGKTMTKVTITFKA
jgi:hypothetical protein